MACPAARPRVRAARDVSCRAARSTDARWSPRASARLCTDARCGRPVQRGWSWVRRKRMPLGRRQPRRTWDSNDRAQRRHAAASKGTARAAAAALSSADSMMTTGSQGLGMSHASSEAWAPSVGQPGVVAARQCEANSPLHLRSQETLREQRTEFGRPAASMRLSTAAPTAASVRRPASSRARSRDPMCAL
jgi:hypothetical protein